MASETTCSLLIDKASLGKRVTADLMISFHSSFLKKNNVF